MLLPSKYDFNLYMLLYIKTLSIYNGNVIPLRKESLIARKQFGPGDISIFITDFV